MLGEIRDNLNQCRALGSERFKDEIEAAWVERYGPSKAGRPREKTKECKANQLEMAVWPLFPIVICPKPLPSPVRARWKARLDAAWWVSRQGFN